MVHTSSLSYTHTHPHTHTFFLSSLSLAIPDSTCALQMELMRVRCLYCAVRNAVLTCSVGTALVILASCFTIPLRFAPLLLYFSYACPILLNPVEPATARTVYSVCATVAAATPACLPAHPPPPPKYYSPKINESGMVSFSCPLARTLFFLRAGPVIGCLRGMWRRRCRMTSPLSKQLSTRKYVCVYQGRIGSGLTGPNKHRISRHCHT